MFKYGNSGKKTLKIWDLTYLAGPICISFITRWYKQSIRPFRFACILSQANKGIVRYT